MFPRKRDLNTSGIHDRMLPPAVPVAALKGAIVHRREWPEFHYSDAALCGIRDMLAKQCGFDLGSYKNNCVERRLSLRIRITGCRSPEDYVKRLSSDPQEVRALINALTINVTEFFRNRPVFDELKTNVLPRIFGGKEEGGRIKIWSAACSTGEEPYTVAMMLSEYFADEIKSGNVSIIATDVDEDALEAAEKGVYSQERLQSVEPSLRARYFMEEGGLYKISPELRKMVEFRKEDLFSGDLEKENDLIICRNLLIYLSRERQEWLLDEFFKGLNPDGFLVLGRAEILTGGSRKLFTTISAKDRIYKKSQ